MASSSSIRVAFPQARLVSTRPEENIVIPLDRPVFLIGSGDVAHLRLNSRQLETCHAVVLNAAGRLVLRDLLSQQGVYVNASRVERAELNAGDEVVFGKYAFRVERGPIDPLSTHQAAPPPAVLVDARRTLALRPPICLIGSDPRCDALLKADAVAGKHALACAADGKWVMRGLDPSNFPRRNGRAKRRWVLQSQDRVGLGAAEFLCVVPADLRGTIAASGAARELPASQQPATSVATVILKSPGSSSAVKAPGPQLTAKMLAQSAPPPATEFVVAASRESPAPPAVELAQPEPAVPIDLAPTAPTAVQVPPAPPPPRVTMADTTREEPDRLVRSYVTEAPVPVIASAASAPPPPRSNTPLEPIVTDLDAGEEDIADDSASSKASIDFEAIKGWGPLAMAVAGAHPRSSADDTASGADDVKAEPSASAGRPWLIIFAGVFFLLMALAAVGWFALHGS